MWRAVYPYVPHGKVTVALQLELFQVGLLRGLNPVGGVAVEQPVGVVVGTVVARVVEVVEVVGAVVVGAVVVGRVVGTVVGTVVASVVEVEVVATALSATATCWIW